MRAPGGAGLAAKELVTTTPEGWGESNLASFDSDAEPRFDAATDAKGPVPVGAAVEDKARGSRLVVFGSSAFVSNAILDLETDFNRDLLVNSVSWAAGRERAIGGVAPKAPEHIKLSITASQLWTIGLIAVLLMPLGAALLGGSVWWLRRS